MRHGSVVAVVIAVTHMACADDAGDPVTPPPPDARPDPGPPRTPGALRAEAAPCAPGGTTFLPRTFVGQTSTRVLDLANIGDDQVLIERVAIEGAAAADVAVAPADPFDAAGCLQIPIHQHEHVVPGHGRCRLVLQLHPTSAGAKRAALHVTGTGFDQTIELTATVLTPPPPYLLPSAPELYFERPGATAGFQVVHLGATPIELGAPVLPPGFEVASSNCPATMTPGAACSIVLRYQPAADAFGCQTGDFSTDGLASDLRVHLAAPGLDPLLLVTVTGPGRVTSAPAGITCGPAQTCTGAFAGAPPVTLTASSSGRFTGWNQRLEWSIDGHAGTSLNTCGVAPTCTVPSASFGVEALFASLLGKRIELTLVGGGSVRASWNDGRTAVTCAASCRLYVEPHTQVTLTAAAGTLIGWSGDCVGVDPSCNLGEVVADRAITATF